MNSQAILESTAPTHLGTAIDAYLAACEVEAKSPRTVQAYRETLERFLAICRREGLADTVPTFRAEHAYRFLQVIAGDGVSLGTRHRRFRETRAFFSWRRRMDYCARSPFEGIPNVKVEQKVIQPLSEAEIHALLAMCDPTDECGCRNRAIILLFLDTGMRYAELHGLTLDDVDWTARRIHIRHGKGRKQRVVPFGDGPADALRAYVDAFRGEAPGALFLTIPRRRQPRRPMNPYPWGRSSSAWGCGPACTPTPTASATPSPPGPFNTMPVSSTSNTCSDTARPTWCGATRRPIGQSKRPNATRGSLRPIRWRRTRKKKAPRRPPPSPSFYRSGTEAAPDLSFGAGDRHSSQGEGRGFDPHLPLHFPPPQPGTAIARAWLALGEIRRLRTLRLTHDRKQRPWPAERLVAAHGAPPGKRVEVAMVALVKFQGDKLAHEHIYWDQASVLTQLGLIQGDSLPVVGADAARKGLDPSLPTNGLIDA